MRLLVVGGTKFLGRSVATGQMTSPHCGDWIVLPMWLKDSQWVEMLQADVSPGPRAG